MAYCIAYPHISHTQTHLQTTQCTQKRLTTNLLLQDCINTLYTVGVPLLKSRRFWAGLPQVYSHRTKGDYRRLQHLQGFCLHSTKKASHTNKPPLHTVCSHRRCCAPCEVTQTRSELCILILLLGSPLADVWRSAHRVFVLLWWWVTVHLVAMAVALAIFIVLLHL